MVNKLFVFLLLLVSIFALAQDRTPDGCLELTLEQVDGQEVIRDVVLIPGAKLQPYAGKGLAVKLLGVNNDILFSGEINVDRRIFHDRTDENGNFQGRVTYNKGRITARLPWFKEVSALEIGGRRISGRELKNRESRRVAAPAMVTSPSEAADYRQYLSTLFSTSGVSGRKARTSAVEPAGRMTMAAKVKIPIEISIQKLIKSEQEQVLLHVRAIDPSTGKIVKKRTFNPFTQPKKANLKLSPGSYTIYATCKIGSKELYPYELYLFDFDTAAKKLSLTWEKASQVNTRVVSGAGKGMKAIITVMESNYSGSTRQLARSMFATDTDGRVELNLPPHAITFVVEPMDRITVSSAVFVKTIKSRKKGSQNLELVLPLNNNVTGNDVKKIWESGPDNKRMNFIFLSDAYTSGNESFSDLNGNGIWDGDLLLDENGNAEWDNGERFIDRNSNGVFDKPEPFEDANGDQICNRFERAEFELTAAMMTAAVMNFEPFKSYSDSINVYSYWTPSTHGAQKMPDFPAPWKNLRTYYETVCERDDYYGDRGKFALYSNANYTTINQSVNRVLPNSRFFVLLVRDPFDIMVSNSAILQSAADTRGGMVLIHEMGHKVGGLADEYIYGGSSWEEYPNYGDSGSPNLTNNIDPLTAKWKHLLDPFLVVPTPEGWEGYGLFEGGSWKTGIYRPTEYSMMRSTAFPFFKVNEEALIKVLEQYK